MIAFPTARREMLVASRWRRTYWDRVLVGVLASICVFSAILINGLVLGKRANANLFQIASGFVLVYCFVAGAHTTFDSISREKREDTLGLLFLSPLSPLEIIVGKLAAHALQSLYGLLAAFPILSMLFLLGGVEGGELFRLTLAALNLLFFSAIIGIFASCSYKEKTSSACYAAYLLLLFVVGLPILARVVDQGCGLHTLGYFLQLFTHWQTFQLGFTSSKAAALQNYWVSLFCSHGVAWLLLICGLHRFRVNRHGQPVTKSPRSGNERWNEWRFGNFEFRSRRRNKLITQNPFFWLAARNRWTWVSPLYFLIPFAFYVSWVGIFQWRSTDETTFIFIPMLLVACGGIIKFQVVSEAGRTLIREREQGTFDWLLCGPLSCETIVKGEFLALKKHFQPAILIYNALLLGIGILLWVSPLHEKLSVGVIIGGSLATFWLDLIAMGWLGIWMAVNARQLRTAVPDAIARGVLLPIITSVILTAAILGGGHYWDLTENPPFAGFVVLGFVVKALFDLGWILRINSRIKMQMRLCLIREQK